jgi:hypothetical protein
VRWSRGGLRFCTFTINVPFFKSLYVLTYPRKIRISLRPKIFIEPFSMWWILNEIQGKTISASVQCHIYGATSFAATGFYLQQINMKLMRFAKQQRTRLENMYTTLEYTFQLLFFVLSCDSLILHSESQRFLIKDFDIGLISNFWLQK